MDNNSFAFAEDHYLQVKGTAMGTKVAPTYATLTLGFLEHKLHSEICTLWGKEIATNIQSNWKRFLDDCFILWDYDDDKLSDFFCLLNQMNSDIQFTIETDEKQIPFLDVMVLKDDTSLNTDIFYKQTDTHQYLHFGSSHPHHVKTAIPYNLARRICTIVSDSKTRDIRLEELKLYLLRQKYPEQLVDNGIMKAKECDRKTLLSIKQQSNDEDVLLFVHTYNPRNININSVVFQLNNLLKEDAKTKEIYKNHRFINSKRQPKSLKRILCSSTFEEKNYIVKKCTDLRCGTCKYIREGTSYNFKGRDFKINANMTCESKDVIYVITCAGCNEYYIGETSNTLRARVRVHKQHINSPEYRQINLSAHLETCGKKQFSIFPFYKLRNASAIQRREKEKHFICTLKPILNSLL